MKLATAAILLSMCTACAGAKPKPLKVYILAGQSNMTGMVKTSTFEHIKMDPETAKDFEALFDEDGDPVVLDEVYVSCWPKGDNEAKGPLAPRFGAGAGETNDSIGPEYPFGVYMHKALDEPVLIIKTAKGGQSLYDDFRPPSAGEWVPPAGHPEYRPRPPTGRLIFAGSETAPEDGGFLEGALAAAEAARAHLRDAAA